jgi:hypothetical protein
VRGTEVRSSIDTPTKHSRSSLSVCDVLGVALDAVPWGAGRMRAPLAVAANGGSAMRHRRDVNVRLRDPFVNPSSDRLPVSDSLPTIA